MQHHTVISRKSRTKTPVARGKGRNRDHAPVEGQQRVDPNVRISKSRTWVIGSSLALTIVFLWSYWPVFIDLRETWASQPDYSHGFLVAPIAAAILWLRRGSCPSVGKNANWVALLLLVAAIAIRSASRLVYIEAIEAWTIPIWLAGAFWLIGGWPMLRWAFPAILFLGFMIPLPFRAETMLSYPLQRAATLLSCWLLQVLGQHTVSEGNVVIVNGHELLVAEACSGLRIFVSIVAVAYVYALAVKRPRWFKALIFASVLPVTLFANSLRIAITGLLWTYVSGDAAHRFSHDVAGIVMIPAAAALFGCAVWYFSRLFMEVETVDYRELAVD